MLFTWQGANKLKLKRLDLFVKLWFCQNSKFLSSDSETSFKKINKTHQKFELNTNNQLEIKHSSDLLDNILTRNSGKKCLSKKFNCLHYKNIHNCQKNHWINTHFTKNFHLFVCGGHLLFFSWDPRDTFKKNITTYCCWTNIK